MAQTSFRFDIKANNVACSVTINVLFSVTGENKFEFPPYSADVFLYDVRLLHKIHSPNWKKLVGNIKVDIAKDREKPEDQQVPKDLYDELKTLMKYELYFRQSLYGKIAPRYSALLKEKKTGNLDKDFDDATSQICSVFTYDEFLTVTSQFLAKITGALLSGRYSMLLEGQSEITVNLLIFNKREEGWGYQSYHDEETSMEDEINIQLNGPSLVGRCYAPWKYGENMDVSFFERLLGHELDHQDALLHKLYEKEAKAQKVISRWIGTKAPWYGRLSTLYTILAGLFTEGRGSWNYSKEQTFIPYNVDGIIELKNILLKIVVAPHKAESDRIYNDVFSKSAESGEYYLGWIMCFTIGINIYRKKMLNGGTADTGFSYMAANSAVLTLPWQSLNDLLRKERKVRLRNFDERTFDECAVYIRGIPHFFNFVEAYTSACDELGLSPDVRSVDKPFLTELNREAVKKHYRH